MCYMGISNLEETVEDPGCDGDIMCFGCPEDILISSRKIWKKKLGEEGLGFFFSLAFTT